MKNIINKTLVAAGIFASGTLLTGCIFADDSKTTVNNFGTGQVAKEVNTTAATRQAPMAEIMLLGDSKDLLRLNIATSGDTGEDRLLAGKIAQQVTGSVSAEDAKVISGSNGDVRLMIRPALVEIDKSGDYYRMNCNITVEMRSVHGDRVFGSKVIKLVSPRRVLGKDAAIAQFDENAGKAVAQWCREELKRVAEKELGVTVLNIKLPAGAAADKYSACISVIGSAFAKLPNLVSYEYAGLDQANGVCQFRVVYLKGAFPSGIHHEVSALLDVIVNQK